MASEKPYEKKINDTIKFKFWKWSDGGRELENAKSLRCSMLWYLTRKRDKND